MKASTPCENSIKWTENCRLEDGTLVCIRPIRPDDAPRLQESFKLLSPQSIYMRFHEAFSELSDCQAEYFANVDYKRRMAFVGTIQQDGTEELIGVARYDLLEHSTEEVAECAVVVRDDYQGLGLGMILMSQLVLYARQQGVTYFIGTVHMGNKRVMNFVKRSKLPYTREMVEPGVWEIRIRLLE